MAGKRVLMTHTGLDKAALIMSISGILSENSGVITMDHVAEIRRRYFINNENISEIAKSLKLSRPTVRMQKRHFVYLARMRWKLMHCT